VFVKGAPESRNDPKISIDHEVWGDIFFNVSVEVVDEGKEINYYKNEKDKKTQAQATILIGGHKLQHTTESVSTNSFCTDGLPPLPSIRFASSGCYFPTSSSILVCGGRENLLSISSSCWLYTKDKEVWEEAWGLPAAVAGAATICMEDRMILLGGVMEEDYYQGEDKEGEDFYDYSTEVASDQVIEFDMTNQKWNQGPSLPEHLQGGCGLALEGTMMVIGGRNDRECSYGNNKVLLQDRGSKVWKTGPSMTYSRFHHGCAIMDISGQKGAVVAGGLGMENYGDIVEFLPIFQEGLAEKWATLSKLSFQHPNQPILGQLGGHLFVHGGGGFPYPGGEDKTEIFEDGIWRTISNMGVMRSFGLGIAVPPQWIETCKMEPNYGFHPYHRKQGQAWLNDKLWFCNGDKLDIPFLSEDQKNPPVDSCTVPGCQFAQVPRHFMKKGTFGCQVLNTTQVLCEISCKPGYKPWAGEHKSVCTRNGNGFNNKFLECSQDSIT